jgi:predicted enzyme related to lactoylglutathione lyase
MTSYAHGQFSWVDLSAHDMDAAKRFYGDVFGWAAEDQTAEGGGPYAIFSHEGLPVAGLGRMSEEMKARGVPPCWNAYVNVDDAEAAAKKAESLGAKLHFPVMKVMDAGWMTFVTDPTGGMFAIWQKNHHIGSGKLNEPGAMSWTELATRDLDRAAEFYGALFGWTYEDNPHSPSRYLIGHNDGEMAAGLMQMTEEWGDAPPHWSVYFTVEDASATAAAIESSGGSVVVAPFDIPIGRIGIMADPHGGHFNVYEAKKS